MIHTQNLLSGESLGYRKAYKKLSGLMAYAKYNPGVFSGKNLFTIFGHFISPLQVRESVPKRGIYFRP